MSFYFSVVLQALEKDPTSKFICFVCYENLNVAYDFKQLCKTSMEVSRLKESKMQFKCKLCPLMFVNANELEDHSAVHAIDLTDNNQNKAPTSQRAEKKSHKSERKSYDDGAKMRFKIPLRTSKHDTNRKSHGSSSTHDTSKSKRNTESHHKPATKYKYQCLFCEHPFQSQCALSTHTAWHSKKEVQYKCPKCRLVFLKKEHMNEHIRHSH